MTRFGIPRPSTAIVVGLAAVLFVAAGSGAALAYWRTSGTGSGVASTGTVQGVTVGAASGTPSTTLIPGGTAALLIQFSNPNSYSVTLTGVAQNLAGTVSGCSNSGVTVPTNSALSIPVPAGSSTVTVPNGALMAIDSASLCQGATINLPVTVTVQR